MTGLADDLTARVSALTAVSGIDGVVGIGIDVVSIPRMATALDRTARFVDRVFTTAEQIECRSKPRPAASFAARFAAKEATIKALGIRLFDVPLTDLEVVGTIDATPTLALHGPARTLAESHGVTGWLVSLSHDDPMAAAVVVALGVR